MAKKKNGAHTAKPTKVKMSRTPKFPVIVTGSKGATIGRFTTGAPSRDVPGKSMGRSRVKTFMPKFKDGSRDRYGRPN